MQCEMWHLRVNRIWCIYSVILIDAKMGHGWTNWRQIIYVFIFKYKVNGYNIAYFHIDINLCFEVCAFIIYLLFHICSIFLCFISRVVLNKVFIYYINVDN